MKLAEALLRRKELQSKVDQIRGVKTADVFEVVLQRRSISDTVDDISAKVPKLTLSQVTQEFDYYSKQLRRIDSAIQQANWTHELSVDDDVNLDFNDRLCKEEKEKLAS